MKRILLILLLFCGSAQAGKVDILFNDIAVVEFAYFVLNDLKKESFVLNDDFMQVDKRVTARFSDVEEGAVFEHLKHILHGIGYSISSRGGFHVVQKTKPDDGETLTYFPKHRAASYLLELAGSAVDPAGFSVTRQISGEGLTPVSGAPSVNDRISRRIDDAIVYRGSPADVERLRRLLDEIDRPAGEVLVKAAIYEVRKSATSGNAVSVALGLLDSVKGLGLTFASGVVDASAAVRLRVKNVDAAWSILSGDSRFRVVSSPSVRVRDGEVARFQSGEEVPTLGSVSYTGTGQPVQSVEYRSSGVILDIKPWIRENDIILKISHQLSGFQQTITGVTASPTLIKRDLQTSVSAQDDELIVIGGLDEKRQTATKKGLPFLPDFLAGERSEEEGTEILLLLHVKRI